MKNLLSVAALALNAGSPAEALSGTHSGSGPAPRLYTIERYADPTTGNESPRMFAVKNPVSGNLSIEFLSEGKRFSIPVQQDQSFADLQGSVGRMAAQIRETGFQLKTARAVEVSGTLTL